MKSNSTAKIPAELLDYLAQNAILSWHKKTSTLPAWFKVKSAQTLNQINGSELLQLIKAKAENHLSIYLDIDWQQCWLNNQPSFSSLDLNNEQDAKNYWPSLEPICRRILLHREKVAKEAAVIELASQQLKGMISQPIPVSGRFLLIEPGLKSGLKIACCNEDGSVHSHMILFPHEPQNLWSQGIRKLENCVTTNKVSALILITGEGYRESRAFIKDWLQQTEHSLSCFRLNGAMRKQLVEQNEEQEDPLYATVDSFLPLVLKPEAVISSINLKSLYHNPTLTIVNQAQLNISLQHVWQKLKINLRSSQMTPDPLFEDNAFRLEQLEKNKVYQGQIINKTDYGYFVDIGIIENGLLHTKQISNSLTYNVGDIVEVMLLNVNQEKAQYALTMKKTIPHRKKKPQKQTANRAKNIGNSAMADALKAALNKNQ